MSSYEKPGIRVSQLLEASPNLTSRNLRACLIGPRYDLLRYDNPDEKENGFLGNYTGPMQADIPGLGGNSKVVDTSARLYVENPAFRFSKTDAPLDVQCNVLENDDLSDISIQENFTSHSHAVVFYSADTDVVPNLWRSVDIGDTLKLDANTYRSEEDEDAGEDWTVTAKVTGLLHKLTGSGDLVVEDPTVTSVYADQDVASSISPDASAISAPNGTPEPDIADDRQALAIALGMSEFTVVVGEEDSAELHAHSLYDSAHDNGYSTFSDLPCAIVSPEGDTLGSGTIKQTYSYDNDFISFEIAVDSINGSWLSESFHMTYRITGVNSHDIDTSWFDSMSAELNFSVHAAPDNAASVYQPRHLVLANQAPDSDLSISVNPLFPVAAQLFATASNHESPNAESYLARCEFSTDDPEGHPSCVRDGVFVPNFTIPGTNTVTPAFRFTLPYAEFPEVYFLGAWGKGETAAIHYTAPISASVVSGVVLDAPIPYDEWFVATGDNTQVKSFKLDFIEMGGNATISPENTTGAQDPVNWSMVDRIQIDLHTLNYQKYGVSLPLYISNDETKNKLYMSYKAFNAENEGEVVTIASVSDPRIGAIDPENPIGYGVFKAMLNSKGTPVRIVVCEETVSGFADALDLLTTEGDVHDIVPLTYDQVLRSMVAYHVLQMSTENMNRWRRAWVCEEVGSLLPVLDSDSDGSDILGHIALSDGVSHLYLAQDAQATFDSIKSGDTVRLQYDVDAYGETTYIEAKVDRVLTSTCIRLTTDIGYTQTADSKFEIWRDTSPSMFVDHVGNRAEGYDTRRVSLVAPSRVEDLEGRFVAGYYLCAALAGFASGIPPHQGQTNSKVAGFNSVQYAPFSKLTDGDLDELAGMGVCILTGKGGNITIRHCVTTDASTVETREEMFTRNLDSISYTYWDALSPYVGRCNVYPEFLAKLRTDLEAVKGYIISSSLRPDIGSQMIGCKILDISQDLVLKDRVRLQLKPDLPYPFNYGNVELWV